MRITESMIRSAAEVLSSHYGIRPKVTQGDLELAAHMLAVAITGQEPKTNEAVRTVIELHNEDESNDRP